MNKPPAGPAKDFCIVHATDPNERVTVVLATAETPSAGLSKVAEFSRKPWAKKRRAKIGIDEVKR